ncbi:MAG: CHASE2 domain-containing protein, partial [Planctomycetes bacterium]|nr:CHASE2 domain-containing protein [Planctomycetota bacterium]
MVRQWLVQQRLGLGLGVALTLIAAGVHALKLTERLEWQGYDWLVRHFSRVPASERILHVDIDDDALDRFGRWPWPRETQGDLVRILRELGAERIVIDFDWPEPNPLEIRAPTLDPYADLEGQIERIGELSAENVAYPDDELAAAVSESRPVYIAFFHQTGEVEDSTGRDEEPRALDSDLARRAAELLRHEFALTAEALAQRLGEPIPAVEAIFARLKRSVAQELIAAKLTTDPLPTPRQVHEALLTTPFERPTADREDLFAAYHRELGLRRLRERCVPVPAGLKGKLPVVPGVDPPVYKVTAGCSRPGFVNFSATDGDGTLRRIPLMVEWDGVLLEQIGFAAARDELNIRPEDMSIDGAHHLLIAARRDRPPMRIQLDDTRAVPAQMMIDWHVSGDRWEDCFRHLPVLAVMRVHEARKRVRENQMLRQVRLAEAMRIVKGDDAYPGYRDQVARMFERRRFVRLAKLRGTGDSPEAKAAQAEADELARQIEQDQAISMTS